MTSMAVLTTPQVELRATSVAAAYDGTPVLEDVSLILPAGKVTALVGPNGSGKSTLLRVLARLLPATQGEIVLDGVDIASLRPRELARRIATLRQTSDVPVDVTVEELVALGRFPHHGVFGGRTAADRRAVEWAIEATHLQELRRRPVDTLSGGERQRAWIAMALAQQTGVLLLDEPTTFLDLRGQAEILAHVCELSAAHGITVGWVLHDLNVAVSHSDHLVALSGGRVVAAGPPTELVTSELVAAVFGVDVSILTDTRSGRPFCVTHGSLRAAPSNLVAKENTA